jgi:hypothetical protein
LASFTAASTPIPWSSSWFQTASSFEADCSRPAIALLPVSTVNSAGTRGPTLKL